MKTNKKSRFSRPENKTRQTIRKKYRTKKRTKKNRRPRKNLNKSFKKNNKHIQQNKYYIGGSPPDINEITLILPEFEQRTLNDGRIMPAVDQKIEKSMGTDTDGGEYDKLFQFNISSRYKGKEIKIDPEVFNQNSSDIDSITVDDDEWEISNTQNTRVEKPIKTLYEDRDILIDVGNKKTIEYQTYKLSIKFKDDFPNNPLFLKLNLACNDKLDLPMHNLEIKIPRYTIKGVGSVYKSADWEGTKESEKTGQLGNLPINRKYKLKDDYERLEGDEFIKALYVNTYCYLMNSQKSEKMTSWIDKGHLFKERTETTCKTGYDEIYNNYFKIKVDFNGDGNFVDLRLGKTMFEALDKKKIEGKTIRITFSDLNDRNDFIENILIIQNNKIADNILSTIVDKNSSDNSYMDKFKYLIYRSIRPKIKLSISYKKVKKRVAIFGTYHKLVKKAVKSVDDKTSEALVYNKMMEAKNMYVDINNLGETTDKNINKKMNKKIKKFITKLKEVYNNYSDQVNEINGNYGKLVAGEYDNDTRNRYNDVLEILDDLVKKHVALKTEYNNIINILNTENPVESFKQFMIKSGLDISDVTDVEAVKTQLVSSSIINIQGLDAQRKTTLDSIIEKVVKIELTEDEKKVILELSQDS